MRGGERHNISLTVEELSELMKKLQCYQTKTNVFCKDKVMLIIQIILYIGFVLKFFVGQSYTKLKLN